MRKLIIDIFGTIKKTAKTEAAKYNHCMQTSALEIVTFRKLRNHVSIL